ncbi:MAG: hypothetical protein Q7R34_08565 [Dehalococcoidia bacterium]|nr:hypothetical protein [Dehalococcoidia bacterium]
MTTLKSRLKKAIPRALAALAIGLLFILLPLLLETKQQYQLIKDGVVAFLLVVYLGKLLFDTLFYDRYWP